jgi:hypothetical protein
LNNKKLEALSKGKERSPVMQVGISNHENALKSLGEYEYEIEKLVNLVFNIYQGHSTPV